MNFKVFQKDLAAELNMISTLNSKTLFLKESNAVKFELKNSKEGNILLEVSFFDNETSFIKKIKVKGNGEGVFYLPSKKLASFFSSFPDSEIEFFSKKQNPNTVSLKVKGYEIDLVKKTPSLQGEVKIEELPQKIIFSSNSLREIIKSILFCVVDQKIRKNLMGMNIRLFDGNWVFVGSDSYRLSIFSKKAESKIIRDDFDNVIVAKKTLEDFAKILAPLSNKTSVSLMFDDRSVVLKTDDLFFKSLMVADSYPDVSRFFGLDEKNFSEKTTINKNSMLEALRVFKNNMDSQEGEIVLTVSKSKLTLKFTSETGSILKTIEALSGSDDKKLAFNINYLIEAAQSFSSDELQILFNNSETPVYVKNPKDLFYYHIIMPLRLDSTEK